jgi:hypothetical protein
MVRAVKLSAPYFAKEGPAKRPTRDEIAVLAS